jgi:hypothetical protein
MTAAAVMATLLNSAGIRTNDGDDVRAEGHALFGRTLQTKQPADQNEAGDQEHTE